MRNESDPTTYQSYLRAVEREEARPAPRRPRLLAALALMCAVLVIVGSFGPWMHFERVSETVPDRSTLHGTSTDGVFAMLFAGVAIVALLIALFKLGSEVAAWFAFGGLLLSAVIGLFDWLTFDLSEQSLEPGERGRIVRVEWGVKLVGLAGTTGAIVTFFIARQLNRD